jgi:hypothetical protein
MMKYRTMPLAFTLLLAGSLAQAQPPGGGLLRMDADGDGQISREEFRPPEDRAGMGPFKRADADGDGAVTREEMNAAGAEHAQQMQAKMTARFNAMDADGNGVVTGEEAANHAFARMDADGDGFVTQEEARAAHDGKGRGKGHGKGKGKGQGRGQGKGSGAPVPDEEGVV